MSSFRRCTKPQDSQDDNHTYAELNHMTANSRGDLTSTSETGDYPSKFKLYTYCCITCLINLTRINNLV